MCTFCVGYRETYLHPLVDCYVVCDIWLELEQWMNLFSKEPINFGYDTVISNLLVDDAKKM